MKFKVIVASLVTFISATCFSQNVGINGTGASPDASSILDVSSSDKGMLIPRVSLTSVSSAAPITAPAVSLMVYNTNSGGSGITAVSPGFYFWNGIEWERVITGNSISATDDQNLTGATLSGTNLQINIENGTSASVNLASLQDGTGTDNQSLSLSGSSLSISGGNSVTLIDNVNDADFVIGNEYNTGVSLSGTTLSVTDPGGSQTVNLSSLRDHDWYEVGGSNQPNSINDNIYTQGNVGIGVTNPARALEVSGHIRMSGGDRILESSNGFIDLRPNDPTYGLILRDHTGGSTSWGGFKLVNTTTDYLHITTNSSSVNQGIAISDNGNVGMGTVTPHNSAQLELSSTSKGFLVSRADTVSISSPAFGLMTLAPADSCLYLYNGNNWTGMGGVGCCCASSGYSSPQGFIGGLSCEETAVVISGKFVEGQSASGVTFMVPYSSGNGGAHSGQVVNSSGVSGLVATISAGGFGSGNGSMTYSVSGIPTSSGVGYFNVNIGGQSCLVYIFVNGPTGQFYDGYTNCGGTTVVQDVTSATGRIWMDRNLGATQVATSLTDANAYGDLFQWGRLADGHQCRNSPNNPTASTTNTPGHSDFISFGVSSAFWRTPVNNNLWQLSTGVNNPCPQGYHVPTETEWNTERLSWSGNNQNGAFNSPLKLTLAGHRIYGNLSGVGGSGQYWSSTGGLPNAKFLSFVTNNASNNAWTTAGFGKSVRCIKDL